MRSFFPLKKLRPLCVVLVVSVCPPSASAATALGALLKDPALSPSPRSGFSQAGGEKDRAGVPELVPGEFSAKRGWLGVTLRDPVAFPADAAGPEVINVLPGTPAASAGFKAGDRITRVCSARALDVGGLVRLIAFKRVGGACVISLKRAGATTLLGVLVGDRAKAEPAARQEFETLGLTFRAGCFGPSLEPQLWIERVRPDGPAASCGLRRGMRIRRINGVKVATTRDALRMINEDLSNRYPGRLSMIIEAGLAGAVVLVKLETVAP